MNSIFKRLAGLALVSAATALVAASPASADPHVQYPAAAPSAPQATAGGTGNEYRIETMRPAGHGQEHYLYSRP